MKKAKTKQNKRSINTSGRNTRTTRQASTHGGSRKTRPCRHTAHRRWKKPPHQKKQGGEDEEESGSKNAQKTPPEKKPTHEPKTQHETQRNIAPDQEQIENKQAHREMKSTRQKTTRTTNKDKMRKKPMKQLQQKQPQPTQKKEPNKNKTPTSRRQRGRDRNKHTMNQTH